MKGSEVLVTLVSCVGAGLPLPLHYRHISDLQYGQFESRSRSVCSFVHFMHKLTLIQYVCSDHQSSALAYIPICL